jgi:hypothetical protein
MTLALRLAFVSLFVLAGCKSTTLDPDVDTDTVMDVDTDTDTEPGSDSDTVDPDPDSDTDTDTDTDTLRPDPCDPNPCDGDRPFCDDGECVACEGDSSPVPNDVCLGVCALAAPTCVDGDWECNGIGVEDEEVSCDGFDNDCDGLVDEDVCEECTVDPADLTASLASIWDIDFDYACDTYLTTLVSGPDWTVHVDQSAETATRYYGNANQNMGYGLVDPDPTQGRVVVLYQCCATCGCQAQNGITLLYTCDETDPNCGCAAQGTCPGFLDAPFISTGYFDTPITSGPGGRRPSTPTGLAVGPGDTYFVGNFRSNMCTNSDTCTTCDPTTDDWCTPSADNCCATETLGRLVQFTLPETGVEPSWRLVYAFDRTIINLSSARDGSVLVALAGDVSGTGEIWVYDPIASTAVLRHTFDGLVLSMSQDRRNGDWYFEVRDDPKLVRTWEDGTERPLPASVPAMPAGEATALQMSPDHSLYRLRGAVSGNAPLDAYPVPLWSTQGEPCNDQVVCEDPLVCGTGSTCEAP